MSKVSLQPKKIEQPLAGNRIKNSKGKNISSPSICRDGNASPSYHPWEKGTLHKFLTGGTIQCGRKSSYNCSLATVNWVKGYRNTCPIAGCCGTYNRPAPLILSDFNFKQKDITSKIKITEVKLSYRHHITGVDVGVAHGSETKHWGGVFPNITFTLYKNGTKIQTKKHNTKVPLGTNSTVSITFGNNIDVFNPKTDDLKIEINYAANGGGSYSTTATNPSILYATGLHVSLEYTKLEQPKIKQVKPAPEAEISVTGGASIITDATNPKSQAGPNGNNCRTELKHILSYENTTPTDIIVSVPPNVYYKKTVDKNTKTISFVYQDASGVAGVKNITYSLNSDKKHKITKTYTAKLYTKPKFNVVKNYIKGQKFQPKDIFVTSSNNCWISNRITVDGKDKHFYTINKNTTAVPIAAQTQEEFLQQINKLTCGNHTLYLESEGRITGFPINIKAPNISFTSNLEAKYDQYDEEDESSAKPQITITRVDSAKLNHPIDITIIDTANTSSKPITVSLNPKQTTTINLNTENPGTFELKYSYNNGCSIQSRSFGKYTVRPKHIQSYDKLLLREEGADIEYDSIVIRRGDSQNKPVTYEYATLMNSMDDITLFGKDGICSIGELGYGILAIKNNRYPNEDSSNIINNVCIELNPLIESDELNDDYNPLVMEWKTGMLNNFKENFYTLNPQYRNIIEVYNIDNKTLVNEGTENVVLCIKKIDAQQTLELKIPYTSSYEREIYMNFLLLGEPSDFIDLDNTTNLLQTNEDFYEQSSYNDDLYASHTSKYQDRQCLCISLNVIDLLTLNMSIEGDDLDRNDITNTDDLDIQYKIDLSDSDIDCKSLSDFISIDTEIINDIHLVPTGYQIDGKQRQDINSVLNEHIIQDGLHFFRGFSSQNKPMTGAKVFLRYKDINDNIQYTQAITDTDGIAHLKYTIPTYYQTSEDASASLQQNTKTTYHLKDILENVDILYQGDDFYDTAYLNQEIHNTLEETKINIIGFVYHHIVEHNGQSTEGVGHFVSSNRDIGNMSLSHDTNLYIVGQLLSANTEQGINDEIVNCILDDATGKAITETNKSLLYGEKFVNKDGFFKVKITQENDSSYQLSEIINKCIVFYEGDLLHSSSSYPEIWTPEPKQKVSLDYLNDYNIYQRGETIEIPIKLTTEEQQFTNHILINHELLSCHQTIHIFYQACDKKNEKGFDTLFKTKSYNVIPNQVKKTIYCGVDTDLKILARLEKKIIENHNVNVLTINAINGYKPNKNVLVKATIGPNASQKRLGDYLALSAVDIDKEKYSYDQSSDTIYWNIGDMNSYETQICNILLEAENIGHNTIRVCGFDYLLPDAEMIIPTSLTLQMLDDEKPEYFIDDIIRVKAILQTQGTMQDVYGQIYFTTEIDDTIATTSQAQISTFNDEHYAITHVRLKEAEPTQINAEYKGDKIFSITYMGAKTTQEEGSLSFENIKKYDTTIQLRSEQESFHTNENIQIIGRITYPRIVGKGDNEEDIIEQTKYFDNKLNIKFYVENQALNNVTYSDNEYMINFKVTEAGEYTVKAFIPETYKTTESFDIMTINVTNGENNDG